MRDGGSEAVEAVTESQSNRPLPEFVSLGTIAYRQDSSQVFATFSNVPKAQGVGASELEAMWDLFRDLKEKLGWRRA